MFNIYIIKMEDTRSYYERNKTKIIKQVQNNYKKNIE